MPKKSFKTLYSVSGPGSPRNRSLSKNKSIKRVSCKVYSTYFKKTHRCGAYSSQWMNLLTSLRQRSIRLRCQWPTFRSQHQRILPWTVLTTSVKLWKFQLDKENLELLRVLLTSFLILQTCMFTWFIQTKDWKIVTKKSKMICSQSCTRSSQKQRSDCITSLVLEALRRKKKAC